MEQKVTYQLVEQHENAAFLVLCGNGQPCQCPFNPVVPTQGNNGQIVGGRVPCNSGCPLAEIKSEKIVHDQEADEKQGPDPADREVHTFIIHCGHEPLRRPVSIKGYSNIVPSAPIFPLNNQ